MLRVCLLPPSLRQTVLSQTPSRIQAYPRLTAHSRRTFITQPLTHSPKMSGLEQKSQNKVFDGTLTKYSFESQALGGLTANFNLFLPSSSSSSSSSSTFPVLVYLSGLTCTEDNAAQKAPTLFEAAARHRLAVLLPDTSPRGAGIAGEDEAYDFGSGAGFYVNATKAPWSKHYRMYDHVVKELPEVLGKSGLPVDLSRTSITGHSMGGHGALTLYLKNQAQYKSASAFSPICHPTACPWGQKAFQGYFADPEAEGKQHDATLLLEQSAGSKLHILVDSGTGDNFYNDGQLRPEDFAKAAMQAGHKDPDVKVRLQEGYDHSYYFIATYAAEHVDYHAKFLNA